MIMDATSFPSLDPVGDWLRGADPEQVGLLSSAPGTTRVSARLAMDLPPERVDEFLGMGLDAEAGMSSVPGSLTREQVRSLLDHPDVVGVGPIHSSQPFDGQSAIEEGDDV